MATTNIAGYQFAALSELRPLRERLTAFCREGQLKGTILLSHEGVNLFVAGPCTAVDGLIAILRSIPGLEQFEVKVSESDDQPFTRMLVKIKKEIIAFGVSGIDPVGKPAPKLGARELKQWLDEKRPITLLDTRNDFEVALGTFENAQAIGIAHFRDFPEAVRKLPESMKKQPIVMFCTGGIRCEKAGPFMLKEGFEQIFQLDGGILKYFEECGGEHYKGDCFVFDKRVALDAQLDESGKAQCFVCQSPLNEAEQADVRFAEGVSCPYCFQSSEEQDAQTLAQHQVAIQRATSPLPGSVPYENLRPLKIPGVFAHRTMHEFLNTVLSHVSDGEWLSACQQGLLLDSQMRPVAAEHLLRDGELYFHKQPMASEPDVNADIQILHEDEAIIAINKPAPLPIHPSGRFNKNTLVSILRTVYAPQKPRPAHRLDANTSGVVVFTRTAHFAKQLQPQFERGEIEKAYLARIQGHPPDDVFTCNAAIDDHAGDVGSRGIDLERGLPARTDFRVLRRYADGTALLEVRPRTGRTNQIRVHLWHLGWPICGDSLYLPGQQLGGTQTHQPDDAPLCLHAQRITFTHPLSQDRMTLEAPARPWADVL